MENFADYILTEKDWLKKIEIVHYLQRKTNIYFDNLVIFKTELVKLFMEIENITEVDRNEVITACLLYACKKNEIKDEESAKNYTKEGAKFLSNLGFSDHFCRICEGVQRGENETGRRMNECDILELVDQFGGMLMHRPERIAYTVDEAIVLLEHRNLKGKTNNYLEKFKKFVSETEEIKI